MDYHRYTINQLSRLTGTSKHLLYDWVRRGLLVPTQISGNRKKFSIEAFLEAERLALEEVQKKELDRFLSSPRPNERIPESFFDSLLNLNKAPLKATHHNGNANKGVTSHRMSHKIKENL
ncbi:MAG: hypothetical protein CH6_0107 [Candidatus Kapaibacterium sp.]|nr:MAG: hypothetical protein CH6_0107 [Candidatus Kapabacteria bacterium]